MLPAVPRLRPPALSALHWATIATRRSFSLIAISTPSSRRLVGIFIVQCHKQVRLGGFLVQATRRPDRRRESRLARGAVRAILAEDGGACGLPRSVRDASEIVHACFRQSLRNSRRPRPAPRQNRDRERGWAFAQLRRIVRAGGARRARAGRSRRRAGRPGRRADREIARRDRAGAGVLPRGGGAAAAQYRLYPARPRIFPRGPRSGVAVVRAREFGGGARARGEAGPAGGRNARLAPRRRVRRGDRGGEERTAAGRA